MFASFAVIEYRVEMILLDLGVFMEEIWKDIEIVRGRYQISNIGRVRRVSYDYIDTYKSGRHRHKEMKLIKITISKVGYCMFDAHYEGKRKRLYVHREVARAFIPNLNNYPCVNHIDEDKTNNCVTNLEWCDYFYNNNYGTSRQRAVKTKRDNGTIVYKPYTEEELKLILNYNYTASEVSRLIGRSRHAIESKRSRTKKEGG